MQAAKLRATLAINVWACATGMWKKLCSLLNGCFCLYNMFYRLLLSIFSSVGICAEQAAEVPQSKWTWGWELGAHSRGRSFSHIGHCQLWAAAERHSGDRNSRDMSKDALQGKHSAQKCWKGTFSLYVLIPCCFWSSRREWGSSTSRFPPSVP